MDTMGTMPTRESAFPRTGEQASPPVGSHTPQGIAPPFAPEGATEQLHDRLQHEHEVAGKYAAWAEERAHEARRYEEACTAALRSLEATMPDGNAGDPGVDPWVSTTGSMVRG